MAKIPVILEAGRADGKLIKTDSIYDDNQEKFLSNKIEEIDNDNIALNNTINSLTDIVNNNEIDIENKLKTETTRATNAENNLRVTVNNITDVNQNATTANLVTVDTISNTSASNVYQALVELFKNATFAGIATPTTNPITPNSPVFYFATEQGVYSNFGGITLIEGETAILKFNNGVWTKSTIGFATKYKLDELKNEVDAYKAIPLITGGYFTSYNIGKVPTFVENSGYRYAQYKCFEGQVFKIKGAGANAARLWYTLDVDGKIVRAAANGESSLQEVTIESREVVIGYNSSKTTNYIFELITSVPLITKDIVNDYNEKIQTQETKFTKRYGRIIENSEFIYTILDAEDRILFGIKTDGSVYMNGVPSDIQNAINTVQDKINKENTLTLPQSKYVNDIMTQDTDIVLPMLSKEQSLCEIKNIEGSTTEEQFLSAINRYKNGESICICLEEDVILSDTCSINCTFDSDLTIEGNGHKIYVAGEQFNKQGVKYGLGYSEFLSPSVNCAYVSDAGDILTLNRTKFYYAESRITDENGNYLSEEDDVAGGIRRFKLPDELSNLSIVENDYVFVNFSCWFVSRTCRVIKTEYRAAEGDVEEGNYLFFQFESGSYPSDYDYSYAKTFCSFFLINYGNSYEGISVKENKIFFPSRYKYIRYCNKDTFSIDVTGKVLISNVSFVGGNTSINGKVNSKIIVENCSFENCFGSKVVNGSETTELYISKCNFSNLWGGAIYSSGKLYACDCFFKNVGLNRTNNFSITETGHYYIARNYIEDYGYGAIRLGLISMSNYKESYGIVECNTIKQSREYLYEAKHRTIMDSGAIYVATNNNPYCVLRYNKIINFDGRKDNRGFFLDDGAYNIYVLGNILENIVNARSIEGRFATGRPTVGLIDNINKVFVYNVCDQGINISGRPNVEGGNGCYLGYNLFTNKCYLSHIISNVMEQEEQIHSKLVSIENGIVKLPLDILNIWKLS